MWGSKKPNVEGLTQASTEEYAKEVFPIIFGFLDADNDKPEEEGKT